MDGFERMVLAASIARCRHVVETDGDAVQGAFDGAVVDIERAVVEDADQLLTAAGSGRGSRAP